MNNQLDHITVCACTFRRPALLTRLLRALAGQQVGSEFTYGVVIIDNDPQQSAREIVGQHAATYPVSLEYHNEPTVGLSYARNLALERASGDFLAIIDDDEEPVPEWLRSLYTTLKKYAADAVFGSVLPVFETEPPSWITADKLFYWRDERPVTGAPVAKGATNNVLFKKVLVDQHQLRFDPQFALSGGCDEDFFRNLKKYGPRFVASSEAIVHEYIPLDRLDSNYIRKRHLLEGKALVCIIRKEKNYLLFARRLLQALLSLPVMGLLLPFFLAVKKSLGMNYYYKWWFHVGVLLEMLHLSPYKDRQAIGLQGR